jgi:Plant transposon protein
MDDDDDDPAPYDTPPSQEAAIAAFLARSFPTIADNFGGIGVFGAAVIEIGILDDSNNEESKRNSIDNEDDDDSDDDSVEVDDVDTNVKKRRATIARVPLEESNWWLRYIRPARKEEMLLNPAGNRDERFRRNFTVPYRIYNSQILPMAIQRWWPNWHADQVDAFHRRVGNLELKILGCLWILSTGSVQFQASEHSGLSEEVHRTFFLDWTAKMSSCESEFIHFPRDEDSYRFVVDEYAAMGLPGCVGSVDCVHVGWDKCPHQHFNIYKGKESFPSVAYEVVCTSRKFIQSVSCGHPGSRNDKHIARTDAAIMNLLSPQDWLASKSWEVVNDADGNRKVFYGSYFLCDGGYHRWPCLVFPVKTGLAASPARKWAAMIESVRKDIEGVFGHLKSRYSFLKNFNRMHNQVDIDNAFVTCCILHNMLLKENGFLAVDLPLHPAGRTKALRKMFGNVSLEGMWNRYDDDTPDEAMALEEQRVCPLEKAELAAKWKSVMEGLMNHYQFASRT